MGHTAGGGGRRGRLLANPQGLRRVGMASKHLLLEVSETGSPPGAEAAA